MSNTKKSKTVQIGYVQFVFESEYYDGQILDTEVRVVGRKEEIFLLCISGIEVENFIEELKAFFEKHRV